jgi:hypothetical protein
MTLLELIRVQLEPSHNFCLLVKEPPLEMSFPILKTITRCPTSSAQFVFYGPFFIPNFQGLFVTRIVIRNVYLKH